MKRSWYRATAVAIGVVGALVLGEIAVRLLLPQPERARITGDSGFAARLGAENADRRDMRVQGSVDDESAGGILYFHTPTGMRLRANTRAVIEGHRLGGLDVEIITNSLGYRNPELGEKRARRVLFLGDSITVQDYLPEQQTMVRLVGELSESTTEPLETINAGVGAIGTANELAILLETGLSTDPDVIVLNWYLNDVQSSSGIELVEPNGLLAYSRLAEMLLQSIAGLEPNRVRHDLSTIPQETSEAWAAQAASKFPPGPGHYIHDPGAFNQRIQELFFDWGTAWADGAWELMAPVIEEMKRQADARGALFLIVAFPVREQVDADFVHDYPQQKLREVAERLDVPMLDLLPILRDVARVEREPIFWDWCHPSPFGSAVIAEAILEFVQGEGGEAGS